jgi:DNA-binding transcriptional LysR family regulator
MDIREAKYLVELENTKHLTKAANNLFITQPALSKTIKKLESEFDGPLFIRKETGLEPTKLGSIILSHSHQIIDDFQDMQKSIDQFKTGNQTTIRLGLSIAGSFLCLPAIQAFQTAYPNITLESNPMGGNEMIDSLKENKLDIAFALPMHSDYESAVNEEMLFRTELVAAVPFDHPWVSKTYVTMKDFDHQKFLSLNKNSQTYTRVTEVMEQNEIDAFPALLSNDVVWLSDYSKITDIPCILPYPCLPYYVGDSLKSLPFYPTFKWNLGLAYNKHIPLSGVAHTFLQFVLRYYREKEFIPVIKNGNNSINLEGIVYLPQ